MSDSQPKDIASENVDTKISESPKKILSIDGGGFRGVIAAQILVTLEDMLNEGKSGKERKSLGKYFDLVAGTSTGAIIAAALADGMFANDILKFYCDDGAKIFRYKITGIADKLSESKNCFLSLLGKFLRFIKAGQLLRRLGVGWLEKNFLLYKYDLESLKEVLGERFGERLFYPNGSPEKKPNLLITIRNATKGVPVYLCNTDDNKLANSNGFSDIESLKLKDIVAASCAAPTFFRPHSIEEDSEDKFIDGGISAYNNPAYQAFQQATDGINKNKDGFHWDTGVNNLLIISVGTGYQIVKPKTKYIFDSFFRLPQLIEFVINSIMSDIQYEQVNLMECLGASPNLDDGSESIEKFLSNSQKKFCYVRLNTNLDNVRVESLLNDCWKKEPDSERNERMTWTSSLLAQFKLFWKNPFKSIDRALNLKYSEFFSLEFKNSLFSIEHENALSSISANDTFSISNLTKDQKKRLQRRIEYLSGLNDEKHKHSIKEIGYIEGFDIYRLIGEEIVNKNPKMEELLKRYFAKQNKIFEQ